MQQKPKRHHYHEYTTRELFGITIRTVTHRIYLGYY